MVNMECEYRMALFPKRFFINPLSRH